MRAVYSVGVVLAGAPLPAGERARESVCLRAPRREGG